MTRTTGIVIFVLLSLVASAQGDQQVRSKADALFNEKSYAEALPLYSQLVSLAPTDRVLNYKFGTCLLFGGTDKDKAIGHLKFATQDPSIPPDAWYWLGRAYHLNYQFKDALTAYQRYQGTGNKKELEGFPIASLDMQCRNGMQLLNNLKEISVHSRVEADGAEFFRFYELGDIGGRIVVLPDELKSALDKKSKRRALVYLPQQGGAIYYASYGKDGKTGLDIYRTELLTSGAFAAPVKLAGYVNTDQDEDYAFMHPDGRSFYFSSKGHNSMGGYDVFRAVYDKTSETFGPAENLDFAVNTPDDDVFYMTDAENKQACFASGRSSPQGKLHVYRVSTAQVPVVVTVMKGTYANASDGEDRKAHIVVEDAVTRERVADVRTDINGTYVLALPRGGRFRYLVECGAAGRTYSAEVDVPRASSPRAYRQEVELVRRDGVEEVVVRNYFDSPVEEDMIGLMLEEIKRRARLDVTGERPAIAQQPPVAEPEGDVLTQAGFAGDVTEAKAVQMAKDDAKELQELAKGLAEQSATAYALASDASKAAEEAARMAEATASKATTETNEEERNALMRQAAQQRQVSRSTHLRARAAFGAGQQMEAERIAIQQQAVNANKLATELSQAVTAKDQVATLQHLRTLKQRLDTKSGPEGQLTLAERTRRNLAEQEKEAARRMSMATAKRTEETELADRIERAKRELQTAKNKTRKEELGRSIAEQEQQLVFLHTEAEEALDKAREHERTTAVARGQRSLINHLTARTEPTPPSSARVDTAALAHRIASNGVRIDAIPVDARYDGNFAEPISAMEARSFDWRISGADAILAASATPTQRMSQEGAGDAVHADGRTTSLPERAVIGDVRNAAVPDVPASTDADLTNAGRSVGEGADPAQARTTDNTDTEGGGQHGVTSDAQRTTDTAQGQQPTMANAPVAARQDTVDGSTAKGAISTGVIDGHPAAGAERTTDQGQPLIPSGRSETAQRPVKEEVATGQEGEEAGAMGELPKLGSTAAEAPVEQGTGTEQVADRTNDELASLPDDRFLLENEKAEIQQAMASERNASRREDLKARLAQLEQRLQEADQATEAVVTENEMSIDGVDMQRTPIIFFPTTKDADIVALLYPDYTRDKDRLNALADPVERAEGLSGLELMLADSIRGEMVRQAAVLELAPQQGASVLPKIERLRAMRQERMVEAERIMREVGTLAVKEDPGPDGLPRTTSAPTYAEGQDPIADRFIHIPSDRQEVFASKVVHRSPKVDEAVAAKEADLERMRVIDQRVDSLEAAMVGLPRKEYDRKRREADRLIDERMIIRSDLGQRSAFLSKEEWRSAQDSLKKVERQVVALGLVPNENLLLVSEEFRTSATQRFNEAEVLRKKADRTEDIILRDSLLRTAYHMELEALNDMDKAITVKTYLIGDRFTRGESLAYDEVARRVLSITTETAPTLASDRSSGRTTASDHHLQQERPAVDVAGNSTGSENTATMAQRTDGTTTQGAEGTPTAVGGSTQQNAAPPEAAVLNTATVPAPSNAATPQQGAEAAERARAEAIALADRTEGTLPGAARGSMDRYESYLTSETVMLKVEALDPTLDRDLLSLRKEQAARESAALEQRSLGLADRATAMEDSAATARKRERERLEQLALRARQQADSLHERSLAMAEHARTFELQQRDAEQAKTLRDRLVKYYYLSSEEQVVVLDDADMSRYFQMKARALEQLDAAAEAEASARANRELGEVLRKEVEAVRGEQAAGRLTEAEGAAKREVLLGRAELLSARADSLSNIAARLRGAANINESQAGVLLQGMPADRSTEWMAMEMRTRRTEPLLAQVEPQLEGAHPAGGTAGTDARPAEAPATTAAPTRNIAPPFGTDQRGERPVVARPIADIPDPATSTLVIPEVLVHDVFEIRPTSAPTPVAIPMDARMPDGIVFKVQIGAFRSPIREQVFSDMTPVMGEHTQTGFIRYTAGLFTGFQQAAAAKDKVRDRGYRDAFVVAYRDGVRIPLGEAMRLARAAENAAATEASALAGTPSPSGTANATPAAQGVAVDAAPRTTDAAPAVVREPGNTVLDPVRTTTQPQTPAAVLIQAPVSVSPAMAQEQADITEQVLAKYPASAQEIVANFTPPANATAYYAVPGAAPAIQVETIKGLFFTVQVGVYSKPVALDKLFNLNELNSERTETGKIRYTTGRYADTEQARVRKERSVSQGVKDAFVTAYLNGRRIPVQEAAVLLQRFGPEILAKP